MTRGVVDPGLQAERTRLSWSRTALGFCATGGLVMHAGRIGASPIGMVLGLIVFAFGIVVYACGRVRYRDTAAAVRSAHRVAAPALLLVVCGVASLTAAFALVALGV